MGAQFPLAHSWGYFCIGIQGVVYGVLHNCDGLVHYFSVQPHSSLQQVSHYIVRYEAVNIYHLVFFSHHNSNILNILWRYFALVFGYHFCCFTMVCRFWRRRNLPFLGRLTSCCSVYSFQTSCDLSSIKPGFSESTHHIVHNILCWSALEFGHVPGVTHIASAKPIGSWSSSTSLLWLIA